VSTGGGGAGAEPSAAEESVTRLFLAATFFGLGARRWSLGPSLPPVHAAVAGRVGHVASIACGGGGAVACDDGEVKVRGPRGPPV